MIIYIVAIFAFISVIVHIININFNKWIIKKYVHSITGNFKLMDLDLKTCTYSEFKQKGWDIDIIVNLRYNTLIRTVISIYGCLFDNDLMVLFYQLNVYRHIALQMRPDFKKRLLETDEFYQRDFVEYEVNGKIQTSFKSLMDTKKPLLINGDHAIYLDMLWAAFYASKDHEKYIGKMIDFVMDETPKHPGIVAAVLWSVDNHYKHCRQLSKECKEYFKTSLDLMNLRGRFKSTIKVNQDLFH